LSKKICVGLQDRRLLRLEQVSDELAVNVSNQNTDAVNLGKVAVLPRDAWVEREQGATAIFRYAEQDGH